MEYIIIIFVLITILLMLAIIYNYNLKKLKNIALEEEAKFNKITDKLPNNIDICKYITMYKALLR